MNYALVATVEQELSYWSWDENNEPVSLTIMAQPGTIINIVNYYGVSPYEPPVGAELKQVPSNAKIGDTGY